MIKDATIANFRPFESVSLKNCKTLNVVLGKNASGKTALLEALFLTLGSSSELAQRLRGWRGMPGHKSGNLDLDRALWSDLFYNFDLTKEVSIRLRGDEHHDRTLDITYDDSGGFALVAHGAGGMQATLPASPVKFTYTRPRTGKKKIEVRAAVAGDGFLYVGAEQLPVEVVFFASFISINTNELVDRFSRLSKRRQESALISHVRSEFDFIENLEVLGQFNVSGLHADIRGLSEKIPVGLVSGGVQKIISILTAISVFPGGVILIDEIENGVYYDRYESLWRSIYRVAKANNVQIFATTHSRECLHALASAITEDAERDVSFIRTIDDEGRKDLEQFHGPTIFGAMELGEVR